MTLTEQINTQIKEAMKAKDQVKLNALRAVKSALLLAATDGSGEVTEEDELKILQKQVKQRKDAATVYQEQEREDLAKDELDQAAIIEVFLPEQMSEDDIKKEIKAIISETGASGPGDMGKVMGIAMKKLSGKADGKVISNIVKTTLSS